MFASFRDAPTELGFTRVQQYHCPSRRQPTWMAQTRNPAPCTALDSGFAPSGAPRNDGEQDCGSMRLAKGTLIWAALAAAVGVPIAAAAANPLLAWRGPVYILAGFAGILALGLMLVQPLLIAGYLPGLPAWRGRRAHRWIGGALVVAVVVHVAGLWITSPPDMIDALLFASPTPFSPFGVIAMWAIFAVALLAALRRRLGLRTWRIAHMSLAVVIVAGSVVHGMLVEGTMEMVSKAALCALVLAAAIKVMADLRVWRKRRTLRGESISGQ